MTSSIRQFWAKLNGSVHPLDKPYFDKTEGKHSFNLKFPPPAFIGDVDNAPVVILMAHGGYNDETASEFCGEEDCNEYRDWLSGKRKAVPTNLSNYYKEGYLYPYILAGKAVIVNAVAYRCPRISNGDINFKLAQTLPSFAAHKKWLNDDLLPAALRNERLVIAHHFSLWGLKRAAPPIKHNFLFSTNSVSREISLEMRANMDDWLAIKL